MSNKPKIVIVDGYTLCASAPGETTPTGEPTWQALEALGDVDYYPRSTPEELLDRCKDASIVLTNKAVFSKDVIAKLPNLKYIGVTATGTNVIDHDAAASADITVTNAAAYSGKSVGQHVFALLLELTNHVGQHDHAVQQGDWVNSPDFAFTRKPMVELDEKTIGIVGLGSIGRSVARIALGFGMRVVASSRTQKDVGLPVTWCELDELFATSDVVSLHCPLTPETEKMINAKRLAAMKRSAFLINTGRGPLIDEPALAQALADGQIAGAGLDVLSVEPPKKDNPLIGAPNCIITPHNAWMSQESRRRLMRIVADNVKAFLAGEPTNVVNPS